MLHLWQSFGDLLTTTRVYARAAVLLCERRNHLQQNDLASLLLRPKCQHTASAIASPRRIPRISDVRSFPVFGTSEPHHRGNRGIDMDHRVMAGAISEVRCRSNRRHRGRVCFRITVSSQKRVWETRSGVNCSGIQMTSWIERPNTRIAFYQAYNGASHASGDIGPSRAGDENWAVIQ